MGDKKNKRVTKEEWMKAHPHKEKMVQMNRKHQKNVSMGLDQTKQLEQYILDMMYHNLNKIEENVVAKKYGLKENKLNGILGSITRSPALRSAIREAVLEGIRSQRVIVTNRIGKRIRPNILKDSYKKVTDKHKRAIAYNNSMREKNFTPNEKIDPKLITRPRINQGKKTNEQSNKKNKK